MEHTSPQSRPLRLPTPLVLAGMALGTWLIYRTVSLPLIGVGLAIFGLLAIARPDLALLFIPLTAPWYLSPVYVPDIRADGTVFPLQEVLLLVVVGATAIRAAYALVRRHVFDIAEASSLYQWPHALFLAAGVLGVLLAVERAPALRDFRWMIVEPLMFFGLACWHLQHNSGYAKQLTWALAISGAFVGALGLLQAFGINLVPVLLSPTKSFSDSVVETGSVARIASVYGHPNNLGMFLGRVWPLAAMLCVIEWRSRSQPWHALVFSLAVSALLLCLGGLFVSFSRGAWLGAVAALVALLIGWVLGANDQSRSVPLRRWVGLFGVIAAFVIVGGLVLSLRGGLSGGSADVRLLFWNESFQLLLAHPFGLGLDQFYYYHNPEFGRSLIDPSLIGTSEQYAKHPHNLFFELWLLLTPLGVVAVGVLLARFFSASAMLIRTTARSSAGLLALGALAAMVAALVHGLVDTFYFWPDIALVFWLLLALAMAQPHANSPISSS